MLLAAVAGLTDPSDNIKGATLPDSHVSDDGRFLHDVLPGSTL